ncbi:hypothetical protein QCA50_000023 [Cerrena zonata]|uniref:Ribosome maturation protein SDO1/SBDS N-terminal domain-containing protein n=1 Tax=Cerrena zonata TaxID=2478898 RepID=A0AAW0GTP0_9APHY
MTKAGTQISKVVYKPDHTRSDEYIAIVYPNEFKRWKEGETTLALTEVVDSFDVLYSTQGSQGLLGKPSNQQLDNDFGSYKDVDVITQILQKGKLETGSGINTSTVGTNMSKGSFSVDTRGKTLTGI